MFFISVRECIRADYGINRIDTEKVLQNDPVNRSLYAVTTTGQAVSQGHTVWPGQPDQV
jgi:hypothetical protein